MPKFRRIAILLLLVALLAAPWASAASPRSGSPRPAEARPAAQALLGRAWTFLASLWTKEGCDIDPNGRCVTAPAPSPAPINSADEGCDIDPSGHCGS